MKLHLLACLLLFAAAAAPGATLNPAAVRRAAKYSAEHRGTSFLVIQNGKTLLEDYPGHGSADTPQRIYSGTKAFWNLAALAAAEDGILNLDERVADTIASWRKDPRKSQVTIRQLLDFSCGLAPGFGLQVNEYGDRDTAALRLPMVAKPGQAFIYGPSALQVFHQVLKEKLRRKTPTEYLEERVLRRMRLGPQRYLDDRAGNPAPRRRVCPHGAAMGEDGSARARPGQADRQPGITRPMLARFAGQPRLFVRLVEQSRRPRRSRVRFRRHAGTEMVTPGLA